MAEHTDNPGASEPGGSGTAPLKSHLSRQAESARQQFRPVAGFTRSDYQTLLSMVERAERRVEAAGIELGAERGRLARHRRVLRDVVASIEDPEANSPALPDSDIYMTALEVGQLDHIVTHLAHAGSKWTDAVRTVLAPGETGLDAASLEDRRFRLQFLAMCRQAGLKPAPPAQAAHPDAAPDGLLELGGWRVGLAGQMIERESMLELAVRSTASRLHRGRVPGMLVLEVTRQVWPERRVLRVDADQTAAHELLKRADQFLSDHADRVGALVDPTYVFGVLAVATLPTYNVATRHVAFSTTFRIASLCDEGDPRLDRLTEFARRFQRAGA